MFSGFYVFRTCSTNGSFGEFSCIITIPGIPGNDVHLCSLLMCVSVKAEVVVAHRF